MPGTSPRKAEAALPTTAEGAGNPATAGLPALLLLLASTAPAADLLGIAIRDMRGDGWDAQGLVVELDLADGAAVVSIEKVELPPPVGTIGPLTARCARLHTEGARIACADAQVHLRAPWLADDAVPFDASFAYERGTGNLVLRLAGLPWANTRIDLDASYAGGSWRIEADAPALTAGTDDGTLAAETLAVKLTATLNPAGTDWDFDLQLRFPTGQLYLEPLYLDLAGAPLALQAAGRWSPADNRLKVDTFDLEHSGVVRARGSAILLTGGTTTFLQAAEFQLEQVGLPRAYDTWLQPFLIGTPLDSLSTGGEVNGRIRMAAGSVEQIHLRLQDLHLEDREGRFRLDGLQGIVDWQAEPAPSAETRISWRGGSAWRIPIGPAELRFYTGGRALRLLDPARVPVLDGALNIARLEINNPGTPDLNLVFDGSLEPVGMESLSRALGWPVFGGTVSGSVPDLVYRDGRLRVGGALSAEVFDGRIDVEGLELGTPFGARPTLMADVRMRGLDLEQLTRAFSFGRIEGRLHGDLEGLRLLDWSPVAVDARFYTPPGDRSRHRISQRAVEALAEVGGSGAAAVLSRGFLRFFDDFAYDRIGIGCLLENGVCRMSGLEPHPEGGYYIVKGRLLPRIDVVGHARDVDWDALVRQLAEATRSGGPVVR